MTKFRSPLRAYVSAMSAGDTIRIGNGPEMTNSSPKRESPALERRADAQLPKAQRSNHAESDYQADRSRAR